VYVRASVCGWSDQGIDVVTSHGYYLSAGDGVDTDFAITWEMIYSRLLSVFLSLSPSVSLSLCHTHTHTHTHRDPADLNWNSPNAPPVGPPSMGGPHFLGAEGCIWGESVWPSTLDSLYATST
jgi:hypothetical protein